LRIYWIVIGIGALVVIALVAAKPFLQRKARVYDDDSPVGQVVEKTLGLSKVREHERAKYHSAEVGLKRIDDAIQIFAIREEKIPMTLESVVGARLLASEDSIDPWNQPYRLEIDHEKGKLVLRCSGGDCVLGTDDDLEREVKFR